MKKLIILSALLPCFVSCLSVKVGDSLPHDEIYSTPADVYRNAVAALYNNLGSNQESIGLQGTCRGIYDYNTLTTDEVIVPIRGGDWYDGGYWENLYFHTWESSDRCLYTVWTYLFSNISRCNASLDVLARSSELCGAETTNAWIAEVRALRAIFFWYAMDLFGNIPIVDEHNKWQELQSPRSQTFRFIFNELQYSLEYLPIARSNEEGLHYGKVTAPVVWFVLAKLALNAEIYSDDDCTDGIGQDGSAIMFEVEGSKLNAWETCIFYCDRLADIYGLESMISSNFSTGNEKSLENIFTIPADREFYKVEYHYQFRSIHYSHGAAYGFEAENGPSATRKAMQVFGYGTPSPDPRLWATFSFDEVKVGGEPVLTEDGSPLVYYPMEVAPNLTDSPFKTTAGARFNKYETDIHAYENGKLQDNDIVLFRFADALLMKAEALVRNGQDGTPSMACLRERAGASPRECNLDTLLEERMLELALEGWRRQDLIRFGKYHQEYDMRPQLPSETDAHTNLFPIPRKCIELNGKLKQNKGYE